MRLLFSPPSLDDLVRLLRAWRLWILGALLGALLGAGLYFLVPPPYQARATVNVDFNLEQAWPKESDRQQFYYLEREVRKLEEVAWSDGVLDAVATSVEGGSVSQLRDRALQLAQPGEAGWHFYGQDSDPARAQRLAAEWARAFAAAAQQEIQQGQGISTFTRVDLTQAAALPVKRRISFAMYLLAGIVVVWFLGFLALLFLRAPREILPAPSPDSSP
jgi:capsular polysaccharide biosynthesis protein